jgi:hypothetical protein
VPLPGSGVRATFGQFPELEHLLHGLEDLGDVGCSAFEDRGGAATGLLDRRAVLGEDDEAGFAGGRDAQLEPEPLGLVAALQRRLTIRADGDPDAGLPLGVERPPRRRASLGQAQDQAWRLLRVEELQCRGPVGVGDQHQTALPLPVEIQHEGTVRGQAQRQSTLVVAVEEAQFRRTTAGHTQIEPDRALAVQEVQVGDPVLCHQDPQPDLPLLIEQVDDGRAVAGDQQLDSILALLVAQGQPRRAVARGLQHRAHLPLLVPEDEPLGFDRPRMTHG